jgi:hypothetical protein
MKKAGLNIATFLMPDLLEIPGDPGFIKRKTDASSIFNRD